MIGAIGVLIGAFLRLFRARRILLLENLALRQQLAVYDGVMYLPNPRGVIQALDAATGDLLWEYRPEWEKVSEGAGGDGVQRNIAIYGDKIFGTTNDRRTNDGNGRGRAGAPGHNARR